MIKSFASLDVCALTCFDDVLTEMTEGRRGHEKKKNRSLALQSLLLPYVWLNTDSYKREREREREREKGNIVLADRSLD